MKEDDYSTAISTATAVPHRVRADLYINLVAVTDFYCASPEHCEAAGVEVGSWVINMANGFSHLLSPLEGTAFRSTYQRWIAVHHIFRPQTTEPMQ
jgi:hypothetical protein